MNWWSQIVLQVRVASRGCCCDGRRATDDLILLDDAFEQILHLVVSLSVLVCLNHADVFLAVCVLIGHL